MTFSILDAMPIPRLTRDDPRSKWLAERALRLTCTSPDMTPLWNSMAQFGWVQSCASDAVPGEVVPERRRQMRAEMDAVIAQEVFGLNRADVALLLDSFVQLAAIEVKAHGEFLTQRLVLAAMGGESAAVGNGPSSTTIRDKPLP